MLATVIDTIRSAPRAARREDGRPRGRHASSARSRAAASRPTSSSARSRSSTGGEARRVHYGVTDGEAWEVGLSCGGEIDVWVEEADPALWRDVRALLDEDGYGMLYTDTSTGEKRLERGVLESTGLRDDGIFAEVGRGPAARRDLRRRRGRRAALRLRQAARLADDRRRRPPGARDARARPERRRDRQGLARRGRRPHRRAHRRRHALPRGAARHPGDRRGARRNARYVGAIGAKRTQERRRAALLEQGFSEADLDRIHGPAGLDLGGRDPGPGRARDRGRDRRGHLGRPRPRQGAAAAAEPRRSTPNEPVPAAAARAAGRARPPPEPPPNPPPPKPALRPDAVHHVLHPRREPRGDLSRLRLGRARPATPPCRAPSSPARVIAATRPSTLFPCALRDLGERLPVPEVRSGAGPAERPRYAAAAVVPPPKKSAGSRSRRPAGVAGPSAAAEAAAAEAAAAETVAPDSAAEREADDRAPSPCCDVEVSSTAANAAPPAARSATTTVPDDHPGARAHDGLVVRVTVVVAVLPALHVGDLHRVARLLRADHRGDVVGAPRSSCRRASRPRRPPSGRPSRRVCRAGPARGRRRPARSSRGPGRRSRRGRRSCPATICETTERTVFDGIAKPTPSLPPDWLWICAFTPITWPAAFRSGPPELPWLIGASVWIASPIVKLFGDVDRAVERADDPARHRLGEPERAADRDDRAPDLDGVRVRRARAACSSDDGARSDDGEVGRAVAADEVGREALAVPERDGDRGRAVDDVLVRDDVALRVVDEAGALGAVCEPPAPRDEPPLSVTVMSTTPWWVRW